MQDRVDIWLDPFKPEWVEKEGYQLAQSVFAQADGGLFGTGFGASLLRGPGGQSLIPAPQTDLNRLYRDEPALHRREHPGELFDDRRGVGNVVLHRHPLHSAIDDRGLVSWSVVLPPLGRRAVTLEYRIKSQRGDQQCGHGVARPGGAGRRPRGTRWCR